MDIVDNLEMLTNDLTIVDFYANWCGPCQLLSPVLERVSSKLKIRVVKVDVDKAEKIANEYGVYVIPTLYLFKNRQPIAHIEGYLTDLELETWINKNIEVPF